MNSKDIPFEELQTITDTLFNLKIFAKHTNDNKLKMTFKLPRLSTTKKFNATKSDDYSLRIIPKNNKTKIIYGEKFYLLAYILPYEKDGNKYYCAVESSGVDIENWGEKIGIKHYLVFEMIFVYLAHH